MYYVVLICVVKLAELFVKLVFLSKEEALNTRHVILMAVLKDSKRFIDSILKSNQLWNISFNENPKTVLGIVKTIQKSTRQLQYLCGHAKDTKDRTMAKEIPGIKRNLELMIFRMKALASKKGYLNLFKVANLKHRRLDGTEIAVQEEEDEEEEDEAEVEEEAVDEDFYGEENENV